MRSYVSLYFIFLFSTKVFAFFHNDSFQEEEIIRGVPDVRATDIASGYILNPGDKVENNGVISGNLTSQGADVTSNSLNDATANSTSDITSSGNGIYNAGLSFAMINQGVISDFTEAKSGAVLALMSAPSFNTYSVAGSYVIVRNSGNGIVHGSSNAYPETENQGIISGHISGGTGDGKADSYNPSGAFISSNIDLRSSGNGVLDTLLKTNAGTISGFAEADTGTIEKTVNSSKYKGAEGFTNSGNGIYLSRGLDLTSEIINSGLIKGSHGAISAPISALRGKVTNEGILAGRLIFSNEKEVVKNDSQYYPNEELLPSAPSIENNQGIYIVLETKRNNGVIRRIVIGSAGVSTDGKTVINGFTDGTIGTPSQTINGNNNIYVKFSNLTQNSNLIINGSGISDSALTVDFDAVLTDSIINGYQSALTINNDKSFTGTNIIFNGGGLKNNIAVIKESSGDNVANILWDSIINGDIDLGNGNDNLTIANTVQINGNLDGGQGDDTLNLGIATTIRANTTLNIFNNINGFEKINTNGIITVFETVKITDANILIESGELTLRVNPNKTTIENGETKIIGHALYANNGVLSSNGGNLIIGLNGISVGSILSMGGTTLNLDSNYIKTNSSILDAERSANGKDIYIKIFDSIPVNPPADSNPPIIINSALYAKLNTVYQSIVTAKEIGILENTTSIENKTFNESINELLILLDQIYANNPYTYTLKSSRDSLKLFEDNLSYLTIKPQQGETIVQGKTIYTGVKNDSSSSESGNNGFDTGHRNYKTTTNTVGGLAAFEYGLSDETSVGFVFGGNNQDVNFKGSSKIKGNSLYLGTFAKTDIKNFKFMSGVGYQYTSADADRKVSNRCDSFSTGDKYDINSLNAFIETKYIYNAKQDWTVEPKVRLSYYYIDQDKINEGYTPGQISMKTDKINSNTAYVEIGVDFVKSLYLNNGKLKNILSLGVINTIGDKSKELNGYILGKEKDGKKFDIQGVELPKTFGKVSYNLELEQINGMIYTVGVNIEFAKDCNKNINATVGVGYKF